MLHEHFTKYEAARILGARALQIAMDAPILLKMTEDDMKAVKYDSLKIAEKEFQAGVLPISVNRPMPRKRLAKLQDVRDEDIDDEKLIAKEKEIEEDVSARAVEEGFVQEDDVDAGPEESSAEEEQ